MVLTSSTHPVWLWWTASKGVAEPAATRSTIRVLAGAQIHVIRRGSCSASTINQCCPVKSVAEQTTGSSRLRSSTLSTHNSKSNPQNLST